MCEWVMKLSTAKRHLLPTLGKLLKHTNPTSLSRDVCVCNCWRVDLSVYVLMNTSDLSYVLCAMSLSLQKNFKAKSYKKKKKKNPGSVLIFFFFYSHVR